MLTGFAAAAVADPVATGFAAGGGGEPHAVATPTAASACRNRLRSNFGPTSRSIFVPSVRISGSTIPAG